MDASPWVAVYCSPSSSFASPQTARSLCVVPSMSLLALRIFLSLWNFSDRCSSVVPTLTLGRTLLAHASQRERQHAGARVLSRGPWKHWRGSPCEFCTCRPDVPLSLWEFPRRSESVKSTLMLFQAALLSRSDEWHIRWNAGAEERAWRNTF